MFKFTIFKKPSKSEVEKAREILSQNDKAHYKEYIERVKTQKAEAAEKSVARVELTKEERRNRAIDTMAELLKSKPATGKQDGIRPLPKPLPSPIPAEPEAPQSPDSPYPITEPVEASKATEAKYVPGIKIEDTSKPAEPKPELPFVSGCPTDRARYRINGENENRRNRGMPLFTSYQQWLDYDLDGAKVFKKNYEPEVIDGNGETVCNGPVYHLASQGYKIARDLISGVVFFQADGDVSGKPVILKSVAGQVGNPSVTLLPSKGEKSRNISEAEFNSIITSKPSKETLLNRFCQFDNRDKIGLAEEEQTIF